MQTTIRLHNDYGQSSTMSFHRRTHKEMKAHLKFCPSNTQIDLKFPQCSVTDHNRQCECLEIIPGSVVLLSCNTGPPGTSTSNLAQKDASFVRPTLETVSYPKEVARKPAMWATERIISALKQSNSLTTTRLSMTWDQRDYKHDSGTKLREQKHRLTYLNSAQNAESELRAH